MTGWSSTDWCESYPGCRPGCSGSTAAAGRTTLHHWGWKWSTDGVSSGTYITQTFDWRLRGHRESMCLYVNITLSYFRDNPKTILNLKSCLCLMQKTLNFTPHSSGIILHWHIFSSIFVFGLNGNWMTREAGRDVSIKITWIGSSPMTVAYPLSYKEHRLSSVAPSLECEKKRCRCSRRWPSWWWEPHRIAAKMWKKKKRDASYTHNHCLYIVMPTTTLTLIL